MSGGIANLVDHPGPDTPLPLLILTIATAAVSQTLDPTCVRMMRVLRVSVQEQDDSNVYMLHLTFEAASTMYIQHSSMSM